MLFCVWFSIALYACVGFGQRFSLFCLCPVPQVVLGLLFHSAGGWGRRDPQGTPCLHPHVYHADMLCRISEVKRVAVLPENSAYSSHSLGLFFFID